MSVSTHYHDERPGGRALINFVIRGAAGFALLAVVIAGLVATSLGVDRANLPVLIAGILGGVAGAWLAIRVVRHSANN